ncbi:hypothetical protein D3C81_2014520 [compost metagenome]
MLHGLQRSEGIFQSKLKLTPQRINSIAMSVIFHPQPRIRGTVRPAVILCAVFTGQLQLQQPEARLMLVRNRSRLKRRSAEMQQPHILLLGYLQYQM